MSIRTRLKRLLGGTTVILIVLVAGYLLLRPWHLRWGATAEELARPMPGDQAGARWTRAITIQARPEQIWPWLVQWGQGRGGWYSYDWLENLLGFDIHTADQILPEFQTLAVGDPICMARGFCTNHVAVVEPNHWLTWQATAADGSVAWNFALGLFAVNDQQTRLVIRESFSSQAMPPAVVALIEIPDVVMEQKALATVKSRAEGRKESPLTLAAEITAWLAALVAGVVAGGLVLLRPDWRQSLSIGIAAVLVLLALTFMFPPLWLRVGLDLALLGGLSWVCRRSQG